MKLRSTVQVEAIRRRRAAIHEAGHLVIAYHLGEYAEAEIWRAGDSPDEYPCWIGTTRQFPRLYTDQQGRLRQRLRKPSPARDRKIAVAGAVAEQIWTNGWCEFDWIDGMSPADLESAGVTSVDDIPKSVYRAAWEVERLLDPDGPLWKAVLQQARRLIVHETAPDRSFPPPPPEPWMEPAFKTSRRDPVIPQYYEGNIDNAV